MFDRFHSDLLYCVAKPSWKHKALAVVCSRRILCLSLGPMRNIEKCTQQPCSTAERSFQPIFKLIYLGYLGVMIQVWVGPKIYAYIYIVIVMGFWQFLTHLSANPGQVEVRQGGRKMGRAVGSAEIIYLNNPNTWTKVEKNIFPTRFNMDVFMDSWWFLDASPTFRPVAGNERSSVAIASVTSSAPTDLTHGAWKKAPMRLDGLI